jgi:hypothetical protein
VLEEAGYSKREVMLTLEWKAHSGIDAFTRTPDGRLPASELRALFEGYRQRGQIAEIMVPMHPSGPLPEMVCFDPNECSCLQYETGSAIPCSSLGEDVPVKHHKFSTCRPGRFREATHAYRRITALHSESGQGVWMSQHWPGDDSGPCLVTTYWRMVFVCDKDDGSLCPSHRWFHAMHPDSYSHPLGQELPRGENKKCMNYYNRPGTYHCLLEPAFMFSPCVCRPLPT